MAGTITVQSYSVKPGPKADPYIHDRVARLGAAMSLLVERRIGIDGNEDRWAISMGRDVWTREGGWEFEPQPSNRNEAFFGRARWTLAEAFAVLDVGIPAPRLLTRYGDVPPEVYVPPDDPHPPLEQAGEWEDDHCGSGRFYYPSLPWRRWYVAVAADVSIRGWSAWRPGEMTEIASGPETGPLGQCLADLALCSRGHLRWNRIRWVSEQASVAVLRTYAGAELTPATLDVALAAVRATVKGEAP
jgi:hypothetical protein